MSQPSDPDKRINVGDDKTRTILGRTFTVNEVHAMILGGTTAVLLAIMFVFVSPLSALGIEALLLVYAIFGRPWMASCHHSHEEYAKSQSIGIRTLRHEPWWYLGVNVPVLVVSILIIGGL